MADETKTIDDGGGIHPYTHEGQHGGMTLRQHHAGLAMQGHLASPTTPLNATVADVAAWSVRNADALIAALKK